MQNYQEVYDLQMREFKEVERKHYRFNNDVIKPIIQESIKDYFDLKGNELNIHYSSNGHVLTIDIREKNNVHFEIIFNKNSGKLNKTFSASEIIHIDLDKLKVLEKKIKIYQHLSDNINLEVIKNIFSLNRKQQKKYKLAYEKKEEATKVYNEAKNQNKMNRMKILFQKVDEKEAKEIFRNFKVGDKEIYSVNVDVDHNDNINFTRSKIYIQESSDGKKNYYSNGSRISKKEAEKKVVNNYLFKNKPIHDLTSLPFAEKTHNNYGRYYTQNYLTVTFKQLLDSLEPEIVAKMVGVF